jgi:DNA-binding response OmpR family regulator
MADPQRNAEHILVVDDDPMIRETLRDFLGGEGYRISVAAGGEAMRGCLLMGSVDAILLDLGLPGEDGLRLTREIRSVSDVPIIMLTGRNELVDRIVGLEIGADDYMGKPFHLRELLARLRTVLRRHRSPDPAAGNEEIIRFDGWQLDLGRRELLAADGNEVVLTTAEFEMLAVLARQPRRVFTREKLMDLTRGRNLDAFERTIDSQIARLRKKIERDSERPALIKSVRGVGYVFTGKPWRESLINKTEKV